MTRIAIIADDLTGALDAAAPFAPMSGGVRVATRPSALPLALAEAPGAVAVSTRSRDMTKAEARDAVARVLRALPKDIHLFKKVDSRLKGPIAAELSAFGDVGMLVAPAIPEMGRFVRNGAVCGFGVETPIPIRDCLGDHASKAQIPDAGSEAEMRSALDGLAPETLLVGARGLAAALARNWGLQDTKPAASPSGPLAIVVGSFDPITLAQVARLTSGCPDLVSVAAPGGQVPDDPESGSMTLYQMTGATDEQPTRAGQRFAKGLVPYLDRATSIVMTGGATAEACLDALGLDCLELLGEVETGIPVSCAGGKTLITKSGGFGTSDVLLSLTRGNVPAQGSAL